MFPKASSPPAGPGRYKRNAFFRTNTTKVLALSPADSHSTRRPIRSRALRGSARRPCRPVGGLLFRHPSHGLLLLDDAETDCPPGPLYKHHERVGGRVLLKRRSHRKYSARANWTDWAPIRTPPPPLLLENKNGGAHTDVYGRCTSGSPPVHPSEHGVRSAGRRGLGKRLRSAPLQTRPGHIRGRDESGGPSAHLSGREARSALHGGERRHRALRSVRAQPLGETPELHV